MDGDPARETDFGFERVAVDDHASRVRGVFEQIRQNPLQEVGRRTHPWLPIVSLQTVGRGGVRWAKPRSRIPSHTAMDPKRAAGAQPATTGDTAPP